MAAGSRESTTDPQFLSLYHTTLTPHSQAWSPWASIIYWQPAPQPSGFASSARRDPFAREDATDCFRMGTTQLRCQSLLEGGLL